MVRAAQQTDGKNESAGGDGKKFDVDELIEQIDQCIFEIARGDITKYDVIGQQPADLFFKWLKWLRRDEKQRMEFEAAIHGIKVSNSGSAAGDEKKIDRMFDVAGNLRGKIAVQRVKKSKKPRA